MLAWLLSGCGQAQPTALAVDSPPEALKPVAERFKGKVGVSRFAEAQEIEQLLPKCPVTSGGPTFMGAALVYNYSRPSYRLSKQQLLSFLGQPQGIEMKPDSWETVSYEVIDDRGLHGRLSVDLKGGYVVQTWLDRLQ